MEHDRGNRDDNEGEKYLSMLGLSHLADENIETKKGTIKGRDFLEVCGQHARPLLVGLEAIDQEDPRYEIAVNVLRKRIFPYLEPPSETDS